MAGLLFWNLYGRQAENRDRRADAVCASLARLVRQMPIDVLVFAECAVPDDRMADALNGADVGRYHRPRSRSRRIVVWSRLPERAVIERYSNRFTDRLSVREILFPNARPILLAAVHLSDRRTVHTEAGRALTTVDVARTLREVESRTDIRRTFLVGDLNMNPYEPGVVGTQGLHAVMTAELARTVGRRTARRRHPCFYNPMWACFGDRSPGPSGTHFYPNADEPTNHFWHVYDQAIIRPTLIRAFVRVEILGSDGVESFLTDAGRPRPAVLSDHLPLYVEFDFTRERGHHADRDSGPVGG